MASKPRITAVQAVSGQLTLLVEWSGNKHYSVSLAEHIRRFSALKLLKDLTVFASVQVGEWGFDVTWGGDLEIASKTLWRLNRSVVMSRHLRGPIHPALTSC